MKRHPRLVPYSRVHHSLLLLAQLLKLGAPAYKGLPTDGPGKTAYAIQTYQKIWCPHVVQEEQELFPFCLSLQPSLSGWVDELKTEHNQLAILFELLDATQPNEQLLDRLGKALETHIRKEERLFFQLLQESLAPFQLGG